MSPILVRPVREQLEHDRLIRLLQTKYKRKLEVAINVGEERVAPVKIGPATHFPDLVLTDGRKLVGLVEVETGESVNNLEAMAQWVPFGRMPVPFHLYVPLQSFDAARRLTEAHRAGVTEIWTYRVLGDQFDLVKVWAAREPKRGKPPREAPAAKRVAATTTKAAGPTKSARPPKPKPSSASKPTAKPAAKPAATRAKSAKSAKKRK